MNYRDVKVEQKYRVAMENPMILRISQRSSMDSPIASPG